MKTYNMLFSETLFANSYSSWILYMYLADILIFTRPVSLAFGELECI
jgi:hypothetical protein